MINKGFFLTLIPETSYYKNQDRLWTIGERLFLVTQEDDDDDCDYSKTEFIYSSKFNKTLKKQFPAWVGYDQRNEFVLLNKMGLPLHRGAESYWKEVGAIK